MANDMPLEELIGHPAAVGRACFFSYESVSENEFWLVRMGRLGEVLGLLQSQGEASDGSWHETQAHAGCLRDAISSLFECEYERPAT